jgi:hypothetical protein
MRRFALALFCVLLLALTTVSEAVTVQITVFCNGGVVYDNAVTVTKPNPTAWDALQASDVVDDYDDAWGIFIKSIAGCGGSWGPAFYVNGGESDVGVDNYDLQDGDQLQFIGPNNDGPTAGILYLAHCPSIVGKGEGFRIKVMEKSAYSWGGYDRPSSGAEVTVGNDTYQTGSDGYTEEITLDYDAYYCVAAEKGGYVATYYFDEIPYIQCGIGGPSICSVTGLGSSRRGIVKYDETSSIHGEGFCSCRSVFENSRGQYPSRSTTVSQKGSGSYNTEKVIKQRPSGIDLSESSELKYNPTTFAAYKNILGYNSKYDDNIFQKNYQKAAESGEIYSQLDYLKKTSLYNNTLGINFTFMADFQGTAELSARTFERDAFINWSNKARPKEELYEEYTGNFRLFQRGLIPMNLNDDVDCKEECEQKCMKHCMEDLGFDETYCSDNCTEYCEDFCPSEEEEYELLPCCSGGWLNMTKVDRVGHSAEGIFDCSSCRTDATAVLIGRKPNV